MAASSSAAAPVAAPTQLLQHASTLIDTALQRGGETLVDACTQSLQLSSGSPLQQLIRGDVQRLHATLSRVLCGSETCLVDGSFGAGGAAPVHILSEWTRARAPIALWGAARCLESMSHGAISARDLLHAPALGDAISPLTKEAAPLLAACLIGSPWRICRLSLSYLAFVIGRRAPWWSSSSLLPALLEDVEAALEAGMRHVQRKAEVRDSPAGSGGGAAATIMAATSGSENERECARAAFAIVGGWGGGRHDATPLHALVGRCAARIPAL